MFVLPRIKIAHAINATTSDLHFQTMVARFSFAWTDKEQRSNYLPGLTGRDFDSTVKFVASTREVYWE